MNKKITLHEIFFHSSILYKIIFACDQGSILKEFKARPHREVRGEYFLWEWILIYFIFLRHLGLDRVNTDTGVIL